MSEPVLLSERHGKVALLTLNRPQARNALNAALAGALCDAIAANQDAGCIVITGADPAFCAGLDLRNLGVETLAQLPSYTAAQVGSEIPMIAAVNGPAVTGGFEVALLCDFMIASERAVFADTHLRVGVYPGPVVVDLPRRVGEAWARQISLSGNFVDAATALRIGLVNDVVPHEDLLPTTMKIAQAIAEQPRDMVVTLRADYNDSMGVPVALGRKEHTRHAIAGGFGRNRGEDIAARREAVLARSKEQRGAD